MNNQTNCPGCGMPLKVIEDCVHLFECGSEYEIIDESEKLVFLSDGEACKEITRLKQESKAKDTRIEELVHIVKIQTDSHTKEFLDLKAVICELENKLGPLEEMQKFISKAWRESLSCPCNWDFCWTHFCGDILKTWAKATAKQNRNKKGGE